MALAVGDDGAARLRAEEGLVLQRQLDDTWGTAYSVLLLGNVARVEGNFARAREHFEESLRVFGELGDEHYISLATHVLAWMCYELGERDQARALYERNLLRARTTHDERTEAATLAALAEYAVDEGRVEDAVSLLTESTRIWLDYSDLRETASNLCRFAAALARDGRAETAARLLSCAEALHEELGASRSWVARMNDETLSSIRAQLDDTTFAEVWEQGQKLTVDDAVALAIDETD